jgi:hypothetical protein
MGFSRCWTASLTHVDDRDLRHGSEHEQSFCLEYLRIIYALQSLRFAVHGVLTSYARYAKLRQCR